MSDHVEIGRQDVTSQLAGFLGDPKHCQCPEQVPNRGLQTTF